MLIKIVMHIVGWRKSGRLLYVCSKRAFSSHILQELDEVSLPTEWYRIAYGKLLKMTHVLKNIEQIDGRIMQANDGSIITDERIIVQMQSFNLLTKAFIGLQPIRGAFFDKPSKRCTLTLNSLTKVCNLLNISAQQRKNVRLTICQQVTQHHIWKGALQEVLLDLKHKIDTSDCLHSSSCQMGKQIVLSCLKYFSDATTISSSESPSWMKPAPLRKVEKPSPSKTWEEVLEMFVDLAKCLEAEDKLAAQVSKVEVLKEGLYQIRDIIIEHDISYKEIRRQDCLVQKKLSKSLGHSSKCLFMLLLYYLYGTIRDIEVEVRGGVQISEGCACVHIGKILVCSDEGMVMNGIKQLNRALGVFKFVWETAAMSGTLELQGHLWCVGAEERRIAYRGNMFFLHGIRL